MRYGEFILLLVIAVWATTATADTTYVQGTVTGTWTADHSPYVVQGDINVPSGFTLHIGSGVKVFFSGHYGLSVDSSAALYALGAAGDSIRFTTDTLAVPNGWRGIRISYGADTSRFRYCVFEFAAGDSSALSEENSGGALYADNSCLDLSDCAMHWNRATAESGGAAFFEACAVKIRRCRFEQNIAGDGGGLYFSNSWGTMDSSVFRGNAAYRGGAMRISGSYYDGLITVCDGVFEGNRADGYGGAVSYTADQQVYFKRCTFRGNASGIRGGALSLYNPNGEFSFTNCLIDSNRADSSGGGVSLTFRMQFVEPPVFEHCIITRNSAIEGGAIYTKQIGDFIDGIPEIRFCVIAENSATVTGGALGGREINLTATAIVNTVHGVAISSGARSGYWGSFCGLYGNIDGNFPDGTNPTLSRVNLNGDSCDLGYNIYLDPQFVDAAGRDYHLTENSPYIDAGPTWSSVPLDSDGTRPEIGAFYFPQSQRAEHGITLKPVSFSLAAYPNPFNPLTEIQYTIPNTSRVTLRVFDLLGRETMLLKSGFLEAGNYSVTLNGINLASGIYLVRLEAGEHSQTTKLMLLK